MSWSLKMKMILMREETWEVIKDPVPNPMTSVWDAKAQKALQSIILNVENNQLVNVRKCENGRQAWFALKDHHQQKTMNAKIRIMKQLFKMQLQPRASMRDHLDKILNLLDSLGEMDIVLGDSISVSVVLASLSEEYETLVTAIEAWDEGRLTLNAVRSKLLEEWEKHNGASAQEKLDNPIDPVVAMKTKPVFTCYFCNLPGHIKRNCPDLRIKLKQMYKEKRENKDFDGSAKLARMNHWYKSFLTCQGKTNDGWFVDSGATCHMCSDETLFSALDKSHKGEVTVASGQIVQSIGKGNVKISLKRGRTKVDVMLHNVLLVPDLDGNLVSVRKLVSNGYVVEFRDDKCYLLVGKQKMMIASFDDKLYKVCEAEKCFAATKEVNVDRCVHDWHRRLAHRNIGDIRLMEKEGLKFKQCNCLNECEMCIKGKMARKSFPKKATPTNDLLDCVVSDVCGAMQIESVSKKKYFVTFIDVHTGYTEVKFLREKSDVTNETIEYIERMKTQLGRKPKIFRSDRGGEYLNNKLQSYFRQEGIKFQCTVGFAPEQNGIAERKNRTLVEAARTMISESGLSKIFWAEAVNTANYVFNRIVSKTRKSPLEMMFGEKPRIKHFNEFGCDAYVMIPYEKRRKLDDKARKMKFVGYDETSKGFRMVDENNKITVTREVQFLDSKTLLKRSDKVKEVEFYLPSANEFEEVFYDAPFDDGDDFMQNEEVQEESVQVEQEEPEESSIEENMIEPPRRSARNNIGKLPASLDDFVLYQVTTNDKLNEPKTYKQAMNSPNADKWLEAMQEELNSIHANETWELTDLPANRKPIGSKWVFKLKFGESGEIMRYKARLVAQGFSQKFGVDYDEVFAPVTRNVTFRMLLSVAGLRNYSVKHYDIKTAFLNGKLDDEIYLKQPPGYQFKNKEKVYRLKKSLYGLKQAARVWNQTLHESLIKNGCKQSETDKCLYSLTSGGEVSYVLIHVDDLLVASSSEQHGDELMCSVGKDFELKNLGEVKQYLGINIRKDDAGNFVISQSDYIEKIIEAAGLGEAKISKFPLDTGFYKLVGKALSTNEEYRKLIGMLLYLTTNTRPDIAASISILSQKVSNPRDVDLNEVRRVIRYLKGTKHAHLRLGSRDFKNNLFAYSDANWAEDKEDRKSNSGYFVSVCGGATSWSCRKQEIVALSSTEAEYVALSETCKEVTWMRRIAKDLNITLSSATSIFTDSQSSISMINNKKFSNRTKHIDTKFHFVQDLVNNQQVNLVYHPTETNIADMMTKPLGSIKIKVLRELGGLMEEQHEHKN